MFVFYFLVLLLFILSSSYWFLSLAKCFFDQNISFFFVFFLFSFLHHFFSSSFRRFELNVFVLQSDLPYFILFFLFSIILLSFFLFGLWNFRSLHSFLFYSFFFYFRSFYYLSSFLVCEIFVPFIHSYVILFPLCTRFSFFNLLHFSFFGLNKTDILHTDASKNWTYGVHTISFQTFFFMGTFINSTHMKL